MMKKINRNSRRKQRGVALLFTLGVLSLLLILGLAFVTNALLAQKVANNNSSRSQAKMLAQSAISRMAISLLYYQYQVSNATPPFIPSSYDSIYSLYNDSGTASGAGVDDGLRASDSKLIPPTDFTPTDFSSNLKAQWSYLTTRDSNNNSRVVGRVAYQLLPSTGSINLDHVLRGVFPQATPPPSRVPWNVRWGIGINELNLNSSTVFTNWESSHAPTSEDEMTASNFSAFFAAYGNSLFSSSLSSPTAAEREKWVRRWFCEGTAPADPEYYYYESSSGAKEFYHRFNLGVLDSSRTITDAWYDRLMNTDGSAVTANSDTAVENLAKDSVVFKLTDELTPLASASSTRIGGLPFLKYIANDPGSFASLKDRRKQIVANLNDYCDSDSIPTSDVDAKTWNTAYNQASTVWPTYTGNEKTPYINELAFGFKVTPSLKPGSGAYATSDVVVNVKVDRAELIAELIKVYLDFINPNQHADENIYDYQLLAHLKQLELSFRVTVNGILNYADSDGSNPGSLALTNAILTAATPITYADQTVTINFKETNASLQPDWQSGYLVYAGAATAPSTDSLDFDASTSFGTLLPSGKSVTSAVINEIKVEALSPVFALGGVVLMDVKDASNQFGVDFVRWPDVPLSSATATLQLFTNISSAYAGGSGAGWVKSSTLANIPERFRFFYLGGMEAKDPRQNLNPKDTVIVTETDWSLFSGIGLVDFDNATPARKLTMNIPALTDSDTGLDINIKKRLNAGAVNTDANPSTRAAVGGTAASEGDTENAANPAWIGAADSEHLSTAYIRNAPMRSPWELGAIHRGAAWETINLKNAMQPGSTTTPMTPGDMAQPGSAWGATGTFYAGGDGGLLEQIKMTDKAYCYGKVNVNMLSNDTMVNKDYNSTLDPEIGRALFFNVKYGQSLGDLDDVASTTGTAITWPVAGTAINNMQTAVSYFSSEVKSRSQFLCWSDASENSYANGFGMLSGYSSFPDAQQEELIGKTIDLVKANNTITNTLRFIVVAQTVRDLDGTVVRIKNDGTSVGTRNCSFGTFDVEADDTDTSLPAGHQFVYYDQITGEVKMLVTMENNPRTGQTIVRQVEYIE